MAPGGLEALRLHRFWEDQDKIYLEKHRAEKVGTGADEAFARGGTATSNPQDEWPYPTYRFANVTQKGMHPLCCKAPYPPSLTQDPATVNDRSSSTLCSPPLTRPLYSTYRFCSDRKLGVRAYDDVKPEHESRRARICGCMVDKEGSGGQRRVT
jgi:hypothetical protein